MKITIEDHCKDDCVNELHNTWLHQSVRARAYHVLKFRQMARLLNMTQDVYFEYLMDTVVLDKEELIKQELEKRKQELEALF